eukprot:scaffold239142_cov35-Tisochrysis_lutea.AAC.5
MRAHVPLDRAIFLVHRAHWGPLVFSVARKGCVRVVQCAGFAAQMIPCVHVQDSGAKFIASR